MWLAVAAAVALGALALAVAGLIGASMLLATLGVPLAAYAALAASSRVGVAVGVALVAGDLALLGYSVYTIVDALQGVR